FSDTSLPQVAISFEVIWGEGNLKEILAILEREKIKATFFMSGSWIANFPELAQEILLKGHEIGKYSFSSIPFTYLTEEDIGIEFANFNKLTAEVLEYRSRLFRPPLGNYNEFMVDVAKRYGYRTVLWSIDSHDLIANNSDDIITRISGRLHYGSIINFRTNSEHLIDALPVIISYIRESGYDILTVSKLIENHNK
ncbi:MAG: polysaccharide deacetylase family protein, partial [Dethiobacteria bacterium]